MLYAGNPSFLLGFHGCDREVAERVLAGDGHLAASTNSFDWLGHGIYFWENNVERAKEWAEERMKRPNSSIREPYAIGAIIDVGFCLSLMQTDHIRMLQHAFQSLESLCETTGTDLPENIGGKDRFKRRLDCAVIQLLHDQRDRLGKRTFDTVRGLFQEGEEAFPGAGFRNRNHIQICVRNRDCIKGYFRALG